MNLFPEQDESGAGRSTFSLRSRPANTLWTTLPTSPIRALWAGENRLFAVAGDTLYEVFSNGTFTARGFVGNDGRPAQILANGNQLAVISNGQFWLDNGSGPQPVAYGQLAGGCNTIQTQVTYSSGDNFLSIINSGPGETITIACPGLSGTCNTNGPFVIFTGGDTFGAGMVGQIIVINSTPCTVLGCISPTEIFVSVPFAPLTGVPFSFTPGSGKCDYVISTVSDSFDLTLVSSAGTNASVAYSTYSLSGTVNTNGNIVTRMAGDPFAPSMAGGTITIGNTTHTILLVNGPDQLTLTAGILTYLNVTYGFNQNVSASTGCLLDDYFIIADAFSSRQINISALLDGTTWNGIDYASKEAYPDNVAAVFADHEELYLFGNEKSTEVWTDTGNANFPFQRIPNAIIHTGNAAPFATCRVKNGLAWISGDVERGCPIAVYCEGFSIQRISTHAIEYAWQQYSQVSDAVAFTMTDEGHEFWIVHFPSGNATWAFDFRTNLWHQRGWWNGASNDRDRSAFHAYVGFNFTNFPLSGTHYGGDWQNGNIYTMSTQQYWDQVGISTHTLIYRIRTAPYLSEENKRMSFSAFEVLMETGPGNIVSPTLDYSVDQGHTFINAQQISSNQPGISNQNNARLRWRRLGQSRSRVFRLTISNVAKVVIVDAFWEGTLGTN